MAFSGFGTFATSPGTGGKTGWAPASAKALAPSSGKRQRQESDSAGFTLIELMVVVGVLVLLGILASSVLMDSSGWLAHYRLRSAAKSFAMVLQAAKMEAIKRNTFCTVTFDQTIDGGDHYDCLAFADADEDLEYDMDGNGTYNPSGDEVIVKQLDLSYYTGVQLDPTQGGGDGLVFSPDDNGKTAIAFNSRGLPQDESDNIRGVTIYLVNSTGNRLKVVVSNAGSIRIEND